jgi:hypothetical protein
MVPLGANSLVVSPKGSTASACRSQRVALAGRWASRKSISDGLIDALRSAVVRQFCEAPAIRGLGRTRPLAFLTSAALVVSVAANAQSTSAAPAANQSRSESVSDEWAGSTSAPRSVASPRPSVAPTPIGAQLGATTTRRLLFYTTVGVLLRFVAAGGFQGSTNGSVTPTMREPALGFWVECAQWKRPELDQLTLGAEFVHASPLGRQTFAFWAAGTAPTGVIIPASAS